MIDARECIFMYPSHQPWPHNVQSYKSRFDHVRPCISLNSEFQLDISSQFLSPHTTYTINLLYTFLQYRISNHVPFKYKLDKETEYSTTCVAWNGPEYRYGLETQLYQFTSNQKQHDFKIQFLSQPYQDPRYRFCLNAIKFQPVEYEKDENLKNENIANIDIELEQNFTSDDYVEIMEWSKYSMEWTTKKELYYILRNGILINNNGEKWFSISKTMEKRCMQHWGTVQKEEGTRASQIGRKNWIYKSLPGSRFDMVAECSNIQSFTFVCEFEAHLLSHHMYYSCYLVYKLPQQHKAFEDLVRLYRKFPYGSERFFERLFYLHTPPNIPIIRLDVDQESHIQLRTRRIKGHPKLRKDGWMEIELTQQFIHDTTISFSFCLSSCSKRTLKGLLVQGIEFRPAKVIWGFQELVARRGT